MNDDSSDSSSTESQSSLEDEILSIGRDIQNRSNHRVGAEVVENRLFREHFGTSVAVTLIVWNPICCERSRSRERTAEASTLEPGVPQSVSGERSGVLDRRRFCVCLTS